MQISPGPGEPEAGPWRRISLSGLAHDLVPGIDSSDGAARVVLAVDGRSGSGKTTLAHLLWTALPSSAVVAADDIAWHAPMFGWADLMADGVLRPFHAGRPVRYRPPAWDERGRAGAVEVPAGTRILIVEGVGASQQALVDVVDVAVWVQSDFAEAERRGIARDVASGVNGDESASIAFWHEWMAHEIPFLTRDRPWERADAIVAGVGSMERPHTDLIELSARTPKDQTHYAP